MHRDALVLVPEANARRVTAATKAASVSFFSPTLTRPAPTPFVDQARHQTRPRHKPEDKRRLEPQAPKQRLAKDENGVIAQTHATQPATTHRSTTLAPNDGIMAARARLAHPPRPRAVAPLQLTMRAIDLLVPFFASLHQGGLTTVVFRRDPRALLD